MADATLGRSVARGATILMGVSLFGKVLATFSQLILAALLLDTDFGLVAITIAVTDIFGITQKIGIREMLMSRQDRLEHWMNPALWAAAAGGVATILVLSIASLVAPRVMGTSAELTPLILVSSVGAAAFGFVLTLEARLAIDMRFRALGTIQTGEVLARTMLQILLAFAGFGAMSIILPRTVTWVLQAITLAGVVRPKLQARPEIEKWKEASSDSKNLFAMFTAQVAVRQGDYFILGLFASTAQVGAYFFAFNLSTQAVMLIAQSLTSALASGLGKLKDDRERQIRAFQNAVELISFVAVPLLIMQAVAAAPLLTGLYGEKWEEAIVPLQILSIAACWSAIGWNCQAMYAATGRFRYQRIVVISGSVFFVTLITLLAWLGDAVTVSIGVLIFRAVYIPVQIATASYGRVSAAVRSVGFMMGPLMVAGIAAVPSILLGVVAQDSAAPVFADWAADGALNGVLGERGERAAMLLRVFVMSVSLGLLYALLSRVILPGTYGRFRQRVRTVMPSRVERRVPGWLL